MKFIKFGENYYNAAQISKIEQTDKQTLMITFVNGKSEEIINFDVNELITFCDAEILEIGVDHIYKKEIQMAAPIGIDKESNWT